ncbi:MAG: signal peptide peptidase SppA [Deltaproteobacteria bacterium]|nr:signal peptide peptidase SppA [Deltaproteobacteria bacterium]
MRNVLKLSVFLALFLSGCVFISLPGVKPLTEKTIGGEGKAKILLMDISGVISEESGVNALGVETERKLTERVREELDMAAADDSVKAVVLRINSPGGSVTTSDIISHELKKFKEKKKIPVVAELMDVAASGGYYVAARADEIIAHPTTVTGSIGVIAYNFDASGLMTKVGIVNETVRSGEKKDIGSPLRPMTEGERRILQSVIDSMYERFLDVIMEGRAGRFTREDLKGLADGRIFTAPQALKHKLIDSIGYLDDAVEAAKKRAGVEEATIITYAPRSSYKSNIYSGLGLGGGTAPGQINLINIDGRGLIPGPSVRFMYLWTP